MARESPGNGVDPGRLIEDAFEGLAGSSILVDREGKVALATAGAAAILGRRPEAGTSIAELFPEPTSTGRGLAEELSDELPVRALVPVTGPRGKTTVRVRAYPLRSGSGHLLSLGEGGPSMPCEGVEFQGMLTCSPAMLQVFRLVERVAQGDETVLVRGETGAGKELVARAIHDLSRRRNGPFHAINCAALPANLLESELFGHARGAFTGAVRDRPGHIQLAHGGTLFLDEVAELPLELQAKLLRVLETRTVMPVGARDAIPVDVRFISATHRSLRREVEAGRFRADLMYRLRVVPIFLPPLRDRPEDVLLLAQRFIEEGNRRGPRRIEEISPEALALLQAHDWPGNVRELQNVIRYAFVVGEGPILLPTDLPPEFFEPDEVRKGAQGQSSAEARRILQVLSEVGGNREEAARRLGISRATLWRRMRSLGLLPSREG